MLTNVTTTNFIRLPDGTEQETIISISRVQGGGTTTDYRWLVVVALFALLIIYPLLKRLYQRLRAGRLPHKK
jgi:hypothetical protein